MNWLQEGFPLKAVDKSYRKNCLKCLGDQHAFLRCCMGMSVSVNDLNLQSYEVLCFEVLHCSMNHIKNVLQELPHHITDIDTLIKFKEILNIQLSKEKIRGVD